MGDDVGLLVFGEKEVIDRTEASLPTVACFVCLWWARRAVIHVLIVVSVDYWVQLGSPGELMRHVRHAYFTTGVPHFRYVCCICWLACGLAHRPLFPIERVALTPVATIFGR